MHFQDCKQKRGATNTNGQFSAIVAAFEENENWAFLAFILCFVCRIFIAGEIGKKMW